MGALPPLNSGLFAGQPAGMTLDRGHLLACDTCGLQFRSPCLDDAQLLKLYEGLPDSIWTEHEPMDYWPRILDAMNRFAPNRVALDVGCYRGDFLAWLPAGWKRMGIEPARKAAEFAAAHGIEMLGATIGDYAEPSEKPGAVTAFDVIEHVGNPLDFLRSMRDSLADDGCVVIMTGATDSWPFRLFGRHYWYSSLPEHVTFYNLKWFVWASERLGMRVVSHAWISSERRRPRLWLRQAAMISIHTLVQSLKSAGAAETWIARLPCGRLALGWTTVPWWKQAADHILVVLVKSGQMGKRQA